MQTYTTSKLRSRSSALVCASALIIAMAGAARAETEKEDKFNPTLTRCEMTYNLKGWSIGYSKSKGEGRIQCDNEQTAEVTIRSHAGGLTAGKSEIIGGKGTFTQVRDISDLFGAYAKATAHAGAGDSASAGVVTKGEISLTLTGTGKGVDVGVAVGNFVIAKK